MASKRQKLAKKKFKEEHPELFPEPEPKDSDSKKKKKEKEKKSKFKRKKSESKDLKSPSKIKKKGFKKHPLRVPGMKPGDSCFICKARDHIAKLCPQKAEWEKNKICLLCRQRGHSLKRCPKKIDEALDVKLCYNCGETGHSLAKCPWPLQDGGTKFATCFVCNEHGHLSNDCPQNTRGIYPKGGCCKICGGVTHLAKDCPDKGKKASPAANKEVTEQGERSIGKVTKFISGDDLDDDFIIDKSFNSQKDKTSDAKNVKDGHVKSKKKQGPKVVNFVA